MPSAAAAVCDTGFTLIVALERKGGPDPTRFDREWMLALSTVAHEADLAPRSVLISHTRGMREHPAPSPALPLGQ